MVPKMENVEREGSMGAWRLRVRRVRRFCGRWRSRWIWRGNEGMDDQKKTEASEERASGRTDLLRLEDDLGGRLFNALCKDRDVDCRGQRC